MKKTEFLCAAEQGLQHNLCSFDSRETRVRIEVISVVDMATAVY